MIISLSGRPGSGKSTIANILAEKLKMKHYYMGGMRRKMAKDRGMTIEEFNKLGEKDDFTDKEVDEYQEELGKKEDDFIIEGRTSFYFIPHSFKIYVDVDPGVAAERVFSSSEESRKARNEKNYSSVEEVMREQEERMVSDRKRYEKYYGIKDCYDKDNFDMIVDSTRMSPEEAAEEIVSVIKK